MAKFDITYKIDDGYVGGGSQHTTISDQKFDVDDSEDSLRTLFWETIEDDMRDKVHAVCAAEGSFIAWAKQRQELERSEMSK